MATIRTLAGREILIEIVAIGASAKVSAIDTATGTEACITAPANAGRAHLEAAAVKKLEFVLSRKGVASALAPSRR
jgi:hypothetical protein